MGTSPHSQLETSRTTQEQEWRENTAGHHQHTRLRTALFRTSTMAADQTGFVSISQLLKRLSTLEQARRVSAEEIAAAVALIFTNSLSPVQFGVLLWALHTTNLDHQAEVLAACASSMREAAAQVDETALTEVIERRRRPEGTYSGGLVSQCPNLTSHAHIHITNLYIFLLVRHSRNRRRWPQHLQRLHNLLNPCIRFIAHGQTRKQQQHIPLRLRRFTPTRPQTPHHSSNNSFQSPTNLRQNQLRIPLRPRMASRNETRRFSPPRSPRQNSFQPSRTSR